MQEIPHPAHPEGGLEFGIGGSFFGKEFFGVIAGFLIVLSVITVIGVIAFIINLTKPDTDKYINQLYYRTTSFNSVLENYNRYRGLWYARKFGR